MAKKKKFSVLQLAQACKGSKTVEMVASKLTKVTGEPVAASTVFTRLAALRNHPDFKNEPFPKYPKPVEQIESLEKVKGLFAEAASQFEEEKEEE